ncbi:hypothetical protein AB669_20510 [Pedobacter sp. BMA]|nr:hypothetical protein AB669_20510 [Pedobacter sp. BMA]
MVEILRKIYIFLGNWKVEISALRFLRLFSLYNFAQIYSVKISAGFFLSGGNFLFGEFFFFFWRIGAQSLR